VNIYILARVHPESSVDVIGYSPIKWLYADPIQAMSGLKVVKRLYPNNYWKVLMYEAKFHGVLEEVIEPRTAEGSLE